jgi:putative membrane protein
VPAVAGKSDSYPELPWKAFALASALAGLALVFTDRLDPHWSTNQTVLFHLLSVLGAGAAAALLVIFAPPVARLLLRDIRAEIEVRQHAQALFLKHGLSSTRARTGLLVLVSLFERRVEIVADSGYDGRVTPDEWAAVIARMTPALRDRRPHAALDAALNAIESLLVQKGFAATGAVDNELPDRTIEDRGE